MIEDKKKLDETITYLQRLHNQSLKIPALEAEILSKGIKISNLEEEIKNMRCENEMLKQRMEKIKNALNV